MKKEKRYSSTRGMRKYSNYSSHYSDSEGLNKSINARLWIFGAVICILMSILMVRLYMIQIVENESYINKLDVYTRRYITVSTPRGTITDRNGNVLATSQLTMNIVYYPPKNTTNQEKWELAKRFQENFEVDVNQLKTPDLKDLFITLYRDVAYSRITEEEYQQYRNGQLSDNDLYKFVLARITEEDLASLTMEERRTFVIYQTMTLSSGTNIKVIKENVTNQEVAFLIEHIADYPGFDINRDWERSYPYGSLIKSLLGSVTTSKQGILAENLNYFLSLGYSRDAKVGRSGLELTYENLLSGENAIYDMKYDENGYGILSEVSSGTKGNDLKLSIDIPLQQKVEEVIINTIKANENNPLRKYFDNGYMVVMNPKTGDILALVAIVQDSNGNYYNDSVLTYVSSFEPGSSIKGVMVYMGLNEGVIQPGEYIYDTPVKIKDTPAKKSSRDGLGFLNDLTALSESSNVFMFHVAMRAAGANYSYDAPLYGVDEEDFIRMRNYFSQFGLGTLTGIDVPNETAGYIGQEVLAGKLLDYAIGQYDTYTPIQLAQYVSTIANDGIRVQPRLVIEAYYPSTTIPVYENTTTVLSVLENQDALKRVQEGFRLCVTNGLCSAYLNNVGVDVAAKTGTAETTFTDENGKVVSSPNSVLVAYAPYDDPEISIACVVNHAWNNETQLNICQPMVGEILKYIFGEK